MRSFRHLNDNSPPKPARIIRLDKSDDEEKQDPFATRPQDPATIDENPEKNEPNETNQEDQSIQKLI